MHLVLTFAVTLLVAVWLSGVAHRSVLSSAVLFLVVGAVAGAVGFVDVAAADPAVSTLVEVTLFTVLFTDALRVGIGDLRSAWRLPGRALLLGLPLVFVGTAVLARSLLGMPWTQAFLLGAVVAPTDPVLSSAIIGREGVPHRLRHLLNVESGLNDGLALPPVVLLIAAAGGSETTGLAIAGELVFGIVLGVGVPWLAVSVLRLPFLSPVGAYEPLHGLAIGLVVYAVADFTHANLFLAAFSAGVTVASIRPEWRARFEPLGEVLTEILKLLALLLFGALLPLDGFTEVGWQAYLFAVLVLVAVRPVSIELSLFRSGLSGWERVAADWFGPKGFASVVYGLLVLHSGIPQAEQFFLIVALVITGSIVAHSSTDVFVARMFREEHAEGQQPRSRQARED